ncbi:MAG: DUF362 domain-containing protein [Patescibacteria group bacterium]|nr:DUF362 domain-containing protein [Patescibacteria group bacterium]
MENSQVIILKTAEKEIDANVAKLFAPFGGIGAIIKPGDKVVIKPNLVVPKPSSTGVTTDLRLVEAVVKLILAQGAEPIVAEGVPFAYNANTVFRQLGYEMLAKKYGIRLINLDTYRPTIIRIQNGMVIKDLKVSGLLLEADKIFNLPVLKTHSQTSVTLGMKNLKGFICGEEKLKLHEKGLSEGIVDLNTFIKPAFTIIDGIVGLEGDGPTSGQAKRMDLLIASNDILALEIVACRVMGFDPYRVKHIRLAKNKNIGQYDSDKITVAGNSIDEVKSKFNVPFIKNSKLLGLIFLERFLPFLYKLGIDVSGITQRLERTGRQFPEFLGHCTACGKCLVNCPGQAIYFPAKADPAVNKKKCIKCYVCDEVCLANNISVTKK